MIKRIGVLAFLWVFMFVLVFRWKGRDENINKISPRGSRVPPAPRKNHELFKVSEKTTSSSSWGTDADDVIAEADNEDENADSESYSEEERLLNIDYSKSKTEEEVIQELQAQVPSLPLAYWFKKRIYALNFNRSCANFPSLHDVKYSNKYWQFMISRDGAEFYLFGAYYDTRKLVPEGPVIRILAMINKLVPPSTFCQFWINGKKAPYFSTRASYKSMWHQKWGNYKNDTAMQPYLVTCPLPDVLVDKDLVPVTVSLVERECDNATTNLKVFNIRPTRKERFAVCVKGLSFPDDVSVRLIEWIELLNLLGAERFFFYQFSVHPNVSKVLRYYQDLGWVNLRNLTLPGGRMNFPEMYPFHLSARVNDKRQNEVIPYNDCLYRNIYSYDYLVLLDTDEIIMPRGQDSWHRLLDTVLDLTEDNSSAYCAQNVYFFDKNKEHEEEERVFPNVPRYMHMLQHVFRSANFTKPTSYVKCFHKTSSILHVHNHYPLGCLPGGGLCKTYTMSKELAQLQHYRKDCDKSLKNCSSVYMKNQIMDDEIWQFKNQLVDSTNMVLKKLGFLRKRRKQKDRKNK